VINKLSVLVLTWNFTQMTVKTRKGTVISYNRQQGYVTTFDGYGSEENESIKWLRKAFEKKEIAKTFIRHKGT